MNKDLNLVDILKDCPKGTKLYSTIHGEVEFEKIAYNGEYDEYPIKYSYKNIKNNENYAFVTVDGRYSFMANGECTLFPSKDQRDWSKFSIEPKFDISTLQPFDKVLVRVNNTTNWRCDLFSHIYNDYCKFLCAGNLYSQCIPYNNETKHLVGTKEMPTKKYITWEE